MTFASRTKSRLIKSRARTAGVTLACALMVAGCGDPKEIVTIKTAQLDLCPGFTLGPLINGYMEAVRWESTEAEGDAAKEDTKQVNVIGSIAVDQKQVTAKMEFLVDESAGGFRFGALKFDDAVQDDNVAASFLSAMCVAGGGGPGKSGPANPAAPETSPSPAALGGSTHRSPADQAMGA
ncbi:MAG: hypothetical protein HQ511_11330 [Rhodospirillales bacterium]|nr:hypothetical protein [Rhodospirillales bacterium]